MTEYHARTNNAAAQSGVVAHCPALEHPPAFMSLAEQYSLTDDDLGVGTSESDDHSMRTIEQEYQAYITASLCAKGTPITKWWEVSMAFDWQ